MAETVIRFCRYLALLLGLVAVTPEILAHRLDEYLQATLVNIEPGEIRLQINFTPGVAVADQVLRVIDRDHNGVISTNEAAAYCELLNHDLNVRLDQHRLALRLASFNFAGPAELRTGWGIIQMEFSSKIGLIKPGVHTVAVKNRHLPKLSVYLINAAQPSSALVQIRQQKRNRNQSTGEITFSLARD